MELLWFYSSRKGAVVHRKRRRSSVVVIDNRAALEVDLRILAIGLASEDHVAGVLEKREGRNEIAFVPSVAPYRI
jgi:NADPH-dependent glutamate synthase beta subunit-like oxidoreductase